MTVTNINAWEEMLFLYSEMNQSSINPADIAGEDEDPFQVIFAELQSANPNRTVIMQNLGKLESCMKQMVKVAEKNHLAPASDPKMIQDLLIPTLKTIERMKSEYGTPQFNLDLQHLVDDMAYIRQDILQG